MTRQRKGRALLVAGSLGPQPHATYRYDNLHAVWRFYAFAEARPGSSSQSRGVVPLHSPTHAPTHPSSLMWELAINVSRPVAAALGLPTASRQWVYWPAASGLRQARTTVSFHGREYRFWVPFPALGDRVGSGWKTALYTSVTGMALGLLLCNPAAPLAWQANPGPFTRLNSRGVCSYNP